MRLIIGKASTTHVDRHNDRVTKGALDGMAEQIKTKYVPFLVEHDPNKHIGVILNGKVARLKDGEFALFVVAGIFENYEERQLCKTGCKNLLWENYESDLNDVEEELDPKLPKQEVPTKKLINYEISNLLEKHLDSTEIWTDGSVYKIKRYIASVGDLQVQVYPQDHNPPHFHVVSKQRNIDARFHIETLELINTKLGSISEKDVKKIQNLFKTNPDYLEKLKNEHKRMG